ncbi:nucleoside phosphorylase [Oricola sp.]|uniref:nucleoside phosphorylase n=1 Tax=Oricola sp. TaxID=1979950 RepID=UPI003511A23E
MNAESQPTALRPFVGGRPPHLPCGPGDIQADVLLPGDPDRVRLLAGMLDDVTDFGRRREFAIVSGRYKGHPLTICSSGIGGPSTEIALVELAMLGAKRVIRIGGMSSLVDDIPTGSFVSAADAIGATGVTQLYSATPSEAQPADLELCESLCAAARSRGLAIRKGTVATTDSYYLGQDRPFRDDIDAAASQPGQLEIFRKRGAVGVDMECQVVLSVSGRIGLKAACLLGVHGNRATNDWLVDYESTQRNLLHIAGAALSQSCTTPNETKE